MNLEDEHSPPSRSVTPVLELAVQQDDFLSCSVEKKQAVDPFDAFASLTPDVAPKFAGTVRCRSLCSSLASSASFHAAAGSCAGSIRSLNQDQFSLEMLSLMPVFGVWDGHGRLGHNASFMCDKIVPTRVFALVANGVAPDLALKEAFVEAQQCLLQVSRAEEAVFTPFAGRKMVLDYGTTGSLCLVVGRTLWIANVGDSRTIVFQRTTTGEDKEPAATKAPAGRKRRRCSASLIDSKQHKSDTTIERPDSPDSSTSSTINDFDYDGWHEVFATVDHNPSISEAECARVKKAGGEVIHTGTEWRVYPGDMSLQDARADSLTINMTRALGHNVLSKYGVIADPDIYHIDLPTQTETIVICASDGVWDVMTGMEALRITLSCSSLEDACSSLLAECDARWRRNPSGKGDNITVVICRVGATD